MKTGGGRRRESRMRANFHLRAKNHGRTRSSGIAIWGAGSRRRMGVAPFMPPVPAKCPCQSKRHLPATWRVSQRLLRRFEGRAQRPRVRRISNPRMSTRRSRRRPPLRFPADPFFEFPLQFCGVRRMENRPPRDDCDAEATQEGSSQEPRPEGLGRARRLRRLRSQGSIPTSLATTMATLAHPVPYPTRRSTLTDWAPPP
jgi:hypothetical protein